MLVEDCLAVNMLNQLGLIYDAAGAVMLGWSVVSGNATKMAQMASTAWGYNKHIIPEVVAQKYDGIVGLALLVVGFGLQGWSGWYDPQGRVMEVGLGFLLLVLVVYVVGRKTLIARGTQRVVDILEAKQLAARSAKA